MTLLSWDRLKKLLSQPFTWTGTQTFADVIVSGKLEVQADLETNAIEITVNNSWLTGSNYAGSDVVNILKVNESDEIDTGATVNIGPLEGPTDAGAIVLYDHAVTSASLVDTEESSAIRIDGNPLIKAYAESDGADGIQNDRVELLDLVKFIKAAVQTTDATVTTCGSVTLEDTSVYKIEAEILGRETDGSNRAMYHLEGLFYREGGVAVQQGATISLVTIESDAAWACVFDVNSNDVRVRVTGAAATINWQVALKYHKVS